MKYNLAQLNVARFRLPQDHPANADFIDNLDLVNSIAEQQLGFVWRLTGDGNNALDVRAFDDPNIVPNMTVWKNIESLAGFVYHNKEHREIMRRRKEWFEKMKFYMVLWWVEAGHIPTLEEAKERLGYLQQNGPTSFAFNFKKPFASPEGEEVKPVLDKCA